MKITFLYLILFFLISSCKFDQPVDLTKPTYEVLSATEYNDGKTFPDFKTKNLPALIEPIKTIEHKGFIYVMDVFKGIHVFRNDGSSSSPFGFFPIPASTDFEIINDVLIVNSARKMFYLKITNISNSQLNFLAQKEDYVGFPNYPFRKAVAFECPDSTKFATNWALKKVEKITCYR